MWSGSGAGIGLELAARFLNGSARSAVQGGAGARLPSCHPLDQSGARRRASGGARAGTCEDLQMGRTRGLLLGSVILRHFEAYPMNVPEAQELIRITRRMLC